MNRLLILFAITIFAAGCGDNPVQKIEEPTFQTVTATEAKYSTIDTTNHYEIDLVYPVIDGDFSPEVLNNINNTISDKFNLFLNKSEFIEAHQDLPEDMPSNNGEWNGLLNNTYGISQCDSIITIWFSIYQYYLGAAHGFTINHSLHFNLNTGNLLNVEDVFKTDSISVGNIKKIINANLPDSLCWGIETDSSTIAMLDNFIFTDDSITLKIDDYALCPYAFGLNTISYNKADFKDVLKLSDFSHCQDVSVVQAEGEIATH